MSKPHLPAEMLDHVVDLLHDTPHALENCCLVSKSWIPRTREHLFASVKFQTETELESWKERFPDPSTSPAHYAKTLIVDCSHIVTAADGNAGGWITGFSNVVHFEVGGEKMCANESGIPLRPFYGFSPVIKSLRVDFLVILPSQVFDLILSLPRLEDLTVIAGVSINKGDGPARSPTIVQPPASPILTGSFPTPGAKSIIRRLLSLPGGVHFRKLSVTWTQEEDPPLTMRLVEGCAHTLEALAITSNPFPRLECSTSIDLSKARELKDVTFVCRSLRVEWVVMALRTVTHNRGNLQWISLHFSDMPYSHDPQRDDPADVRRIIGDDMYSEWMEFDQLLVQLWESHSIRPKVMCCAPPLKDQDGYSCAELLLPELTRRGAIGLIE